MVKLTLQACLASIAVSFVLFPGMASAQDDETIDYFIRPPEELNLDSELEDAISRTIRTFNAELTNTGRFRQRADMEMQSVISSCIDDSSSNPDAARNCTIMQANLLQIQYIIEFWMDDFGGDEYQLSLTLWNTETSANEATFVEDIEADSAVRAARTAMPILASHVIGRFSSPAYLEVTSMSPSSGVSLTINGRPADPPRAGGRIETFPGTLGLVATANGYGPWTRTVTVAAGATESIAIDLPASPATLVISCNIDDALIIVDGAELGTTDRHDEVEVEVASNSQSLSIERPGYRSYRQPLSLRGGETRDIEVEMEEGSDDPRDNPTYGEYTLDRHFSSPMTMSGTSGNTEPAPSGCLGYRAERPGHILTIEDAIDEPLRFYLTQSDGDTTMVIEGPLGSDGTGQVRCDDDGGVDLWPQIEDSFPRGTYRIWVGSYGSYSTYNYTLAISRRSELVPSGATSLSSGFWPQPWTESGTSSATQSAPSGCVGYIGSEPNHTVVFDTWMPYVAFYLTNSGGDTTMVIESENGTVWCDDDSGEGLWPAITGSLDAGTYNIWVGSYSSGQAHDYTLAIDESYVPADLLDSDMDGIGDALDSCPYEAEDFDGDNDWDGCPDYAPQYNPNNGGSCLSDADCGANGDCMYPGTCTYGRLGELFRATEVGNASQFFTYSDSSCNYDSDCGPYLCSGGWCVAPENLGYSLPTRAEIEYYDGSCASQPDCGSWSCDGTWCRPSNRSGGGGGYVPPTPTVTDNGYTCSEATYNCAAASNPIYPDPFQLSGASGGTNPAPGGCWGNINYTPDHVVYLNSYFPNLHWYIPYADGDTTLVIEGPGGQMWCDDDSYGNLQPSVTGSFPSGTYRVWVGSYWQGEYHNYTLNLSSY